MTRAPDEDETVRVLITFHGTLVRYDPGARRMRHDAIGADNANLFAVQRGADVVLAWRDGETLRALDRDLLPDGDPAILNVTRPAADLLALSAEGRFLRADRDGSLAFVHARALDWERFVAIDPDDLARLAFILTNRWFAASSGAFVAPEEDHGVGRHMVQFGPNRYRVTDLIEAARADPSASPVPRDLFLCHDGWKTERYILYRPLAYYVAYGKEELFNCAEIAIRTLFEFGEWDGDVLFITDPAHVDFPQRLPANIRARLRVEVVPASDVLDYNLARYAIADLAWVEAYQPVIYIDTDVVCDAPLQKMSRTISLTPELHAMPEYALGTPGNFYGQSLMAADGMAVDPEQLGYCAGIFAFRDIREQRRLLRTIAATARRVTSMAGDRDAFDVYDQPFFNYVTRKTKSCTGAVFWHVVQMHLSFRPLLTTTVGKGFVHFAGGVGNSTPKLTHMLTYLEVLARERRQRTAPPAG